MMPTRRRLRRWLVGSKRCAAALAQLRAVNRVTFPWLAEIDALPVQRGGDDAP